MKLLIALIAITAPLVAQDRFDFATLDKLGANAKRKTAVTLDHDMLKMAASFLDGKTGPEAKNLVDGLESVLIRSFEYPKDGLYSETDLEPFRSYLRQVRWNRIVEARDDNEISEIYVLHESDRKVGGVAILSIEPRAVTVVYIKGLLKLEDIGKLSGNLGIPDLGDLRDKVRSGEKKIKE